MEIARISSDQKASTRSRTRSGSFTCFLIDQHCSGRTVHSSFWMSEEERGTEKRKIGAEMKRFKVGPLDNHAAA